MSQAINLRRAQLFEYTFDDIHTKTATNEVKDATGKEQDGTITGGVTVGSRCPYGESVRITDSSQEIDTGASPALTGADELTAAIAVKLDLSNIPADTNYGFFGQSQQSDTWGFNYVNKGDPDLIEFSVADGDGDRTKGQIEDPHQGWYILVGTYDDGLVELYRYGELVDSGENELIDGSIDGGQNIYLSDGSGTVYGSGSGHFEGWIGYASFWTRKLNPAEIQHIGRGVSRRVVRV